MEGTLPRFIVTEYPPWYLNSEYKGEVFSCDCTEGLFQEVVHLMVCKQQDLSDRDKRLKPKTIYKNIRTMVIDQAESIQQKPSRSLLLALMDLVDIEGGNELESMSSIDKAGLKHMLLAYGDYTAFYIPAKELISPSGKRVIPVVTQYSETHNLIYYDISRSMIGTYIVSNSRSGKYHGEAYFIQEVLFVPGLESLELLKRVTGNKFEFWDMTLEVPTHSTAVTPSFQHIPPTQLLRTEDKNLSTQMMCNDNYTLISQMEEMPPVCCVVDMASAEILKKKSEASVDCFNEKLVRGDLRHFHYKDGCTRIEYFRRNGKWLDGKPVNLVPVIALREDQAQAPVLYVSTTVRFMRAVKHCCVKGNGELVSCWKATMKELARDTFITGTDMYQEVHNLALTAFIKRVHPNSWSNYIPRHVESMIMDPMMVEMVELGIKFMDKKIPKAFAVAELLYCPIQKVREYLDFWERYSSDNAIHTAVRKKRIRMVEAQMRMDWAALAKIASSYGRKKYGEGNVEMTSAWDELFKHKTLDNAAKAQKMWHTLVKRETSKKMDKEMKQLYANAKVLFLKLRTHHKKLKKWLKVGGGGCSSRSNKAEDADVSSNCPAEVEKHDEDAMACVSEEDDGLYSIIIPESIPISTWIKNMSTLLLSEPWLNNEPLRREAVYALLRLDNTLLDRRYYNILQDWVVNNRPVVDILKHYGLQDRLSKALVDCLESTSSDNWRRKILSSFQGTPDQPSLRGYLDQPMAKPSKRQGKMRPLAQSKKRDLPSKHPATKGVGKYTKKEVSFDPKMVKRDRSASNFKKSPASKSSSSKIDKKNRDSRVHSRRRRYSDDEDDWMREVEEVYCEKDEECEEDEDEILSEDLEDTKDYDEAESPNEYDYRDNFMVHDLSSDEEDEYSEEEEEELCEQVKRRAEKAKCKMNNVKGGCKYKRMSHSESVEDEHSPEPACSGMIEEGKVGFKRALPSDSYEFIKRDAKRVKRTKGNCHSDESDKKRSRSAKPVKDPPIQHFDGEDKTCTKKKHKGKPDTKYEKAKAVKNKRTTKQESSLYKRKLSNLDSDDYEGVEKRGKDIKEINPLKIHPTRSPVRNYDTEQEEKRQKKRSSTRKGRPANTPRQTCEERESEKSIEQEAVEKRGHSYHASSKSSCRTPGVSESKERRLSGEAAKTATSIDQAVWLTDTLEQESSDYTERCRELDREESRLDREAHANQPADSKTRDQPTNRPATNGVGKCAMKEARFDPKAVKRDHSASKLMMSPASKSSVSKIDKKNRDSRVHSTRRRYSDDEDDWMCGEDEDEILGEDLEDTKNYDEPTCRPCSGSRIV